MPPHSAAIEKIGRKSAFGWESGGAFFHRKLRPIRWSPAFYIQKQYFLRRQKTHRLRLECR